MLRTIQRQGMSIMLVATFILISLSGCERSVERQSDFSMRQLSFIDVPGVTEEEIKAIQELQRQQISFIYGMPLSTEAFFGEDGEVKGFATLFSDWLSSLFEIPFKPTIYSWDDLTT